MGRCGLFHVLVTTTQQIVACERILTNRINERFVRSAVRRPLSVFYLHPFYITVFDSATTRP